MKKLITIIFLFISVSASFAQTAEETEMFNLINQVRTNPKSFVPVVEAFIADLNTEKVINVNGVKMKMTKKVDPALITEAQQLIAFLNTVKPVGTLKSSSTTYGISKTHAEYMDSTKQVTHTSANGQSYSSRLKAFGLTGGENCTTGSDPKHAMVLLLLDFKAKVKGHRNNIFNPQYTKVSVAKSGNYWVQDFIN